MRGEMVNVSDLNQYLYCPRRYWYLHFFDTQGENFERIDGSTTHERKSTRSNWINEMYIESDQLGLKGKIDVLEIDHGELVPIERKRASSGTYYRNDEIQLAGYSLLLEQEVDKRIDYGIIYLYSTDEREKIQITHDLRSAVRDTIQDIQNLSVSNVPPLTDNPNKCKKCSTRRYCMPEETAILEPEKAQGTGWENHV